MTSLRDAKLGGLLFAAAVPGGGCTYLRLMQKKTHLPWTASWACAALLVACAGAAFADGKHPAGEDEHELAENLPAWDETSGRRVATWGKTRSFDFVSSKIELDIPTMSLPQLQGRVTHEARVISSPQREMVLDCSGPQVSSVRVNGEAAQFVMRRGASFLGTFPGLRDQAGETPRQELVIALPREMAPGAGVQVVIDYALDFANNKGVGLTWYKQDDASKPFVHAQGQAELSSLWFPCFDSPAEFVKSEVVVTVEDGFTVIANGTLQSTTKARDGRNVWAWSMPKEHAVYLTTVAIGDFEQIDVGGENSARPALAMPVWVPAGKSDIARTIFAKTAPIIAFFEEKFDERFAWPQYGQAIVPGFVWGGMENVGMTFYTSKMFTNMEKPDGQARVDGLIAHETAHQWWGNLVTCKTWDDLWINEGWATFCESLWFEHAAAAEGVGAQEEAYLKEVRGWLAGQIRDNKASAPRDVALVSNRFRDPDSQFVKDDNPYPKGALVLHALREKLGDRVFFAASRAFLNGHAGSPVETADLRKQFEKTSGRSLERFFEQWTLRPGIARLQANCVWDAGSSSVTVTLEQVQTIDRWNPAYALELPIVLWFADGSSQRTVVSFDTQKTSATVSAASMPSVVAIDPRMSELAEIRGRVTVFAGGLEGGLGGLKTPEEEAMKNKSKKEAPVSEAPADVGAVSVGGG